MRILRATRRAAVIALTRKDLETLLDLLVEGQAEWEDGVQQGWADETDSPYWVDGTGERLSRRLANALSVVDGRARRASN